MNDELQNKADKLRKSENELKGQLEEVEKQIKEIENQDHTKLWQVIFENREVLLK